MAYKQDIELLNQGILPDSLNFNLTTTNEVDIERLQYNVFYRQYEFWQSKFPDGHQSIPGFEKVIDHIAKNSKSPLDEILEKQSIEPVVRPPLPPLINPTI